MREKRNHSVRSSFSESKEAKRKYFLVCEGTETEPIYFEGIMRYQNFSQISPLIEMVPIIRGQSEIGWSNPKKLLDCVMDDIAAEKVGSVTYNTLIDCIVDETCPPQSSQKDFCKLIKSICEKILKVDLKSPVSDIELVCKRIEEEAQLTKLVDTIPDIIRASYGINYEEEFDKICFVIDRDKNSFIKSSNPKNDQYGYVLSKCRENKFGFYITNPCFEYWLLLHFSEALSLDEEKLIENKRYNSFGIESKNGKTYTEMKLRELLPGYQKNKYDVEKLIHNIDLAIEQEKQVCEDEELLECNIGSRIGKLIEELRNS